MNPINFPQSNVLLKRPKGMTEEECHDLPILAVQLEDETPILISQWQPTEEEKKAIAEGMPITLMIYSSAHPPVKLVAYDVFIPPKKEPEKSNLIILPGTKSVQ